MTKQLSSHVSQFSCLGNYFFTQVPRNVRPVLSSSRSITTDPNPSRWPPRHHNHSCQPLACTKNTILCQHGILQNFPSKAARSGLSEPGFFHRRIGLRSSRQLDQPLIYYRILTAEPDAMATTMEASPY